jgi:flavin-dependent dehydrogenase
MEWASGESNAEYDIAICGAGLAGLTLARQIAKEIPEASLLLIEGTGDKSRTAAIQVGESTIELSANYLANVLDLREYLETSHFRKWGFRFFFGNGSAQFQDRPELGTSEPSAIDSFQLDRAVLETDLKKLNIAMGIQMLPESKVEDIVLAEADGLHEITVFQRSTNQRQTIKSRWIVDAMGRRRFIQKKLGIAEPQNSHYSAAWFRLEGRIDVCNLVPLTEKEWHARVPNEKRYFSTNHLMGNGRWVWLIPLASGHTSIGIVTHEDFFPFGEYNTYERALQWLQKYEPLLKNLIGTRQPVDFQCLRHYSYTAKQVFSIQRWACTGDAAIFSDPFLSPGIDQIGFANTLITEMIKLDRAHQLESRLVNTLNDAFLSFHTGTVWIIQPAYAFFGDALVMGTKLVWDIARGFSLSASQRFNHIYLDEQKTSALQPILSRLFLLTLRMEKLFKEWASRTQNKYSYKFIDYFAVPGMKELYQRNFKANKTVEELLVDHQMTLDYLEEFVQIIFLIALADTMPEMLNRLPSPLWLNAWGIGLDPRRWKAEKLFTPTTKPRPLGISQFSPLFGVTDLPYHLVQSEVKPIA